MRTNLLIRQPIEGFELSAMTLRPSRADMQIASRKRQKVSEKLFLRLNITHFNCSRPYLKMNSINSIIDTLSKLLTNIIHKTYNRTPPFSFDLAQWDLLRAQVIFDTVQPNEATDWNSCTTEIEYTKLLLEIGLLQHDLLPELIEKDQLLGLMKRILWTRTSLQSKEMAHFWIKAAVVNECVNIENKLALLEQLRSVKLTRLNFSHPGQEVMKTASKQSWWPFLNRQNVETC